MTIDIESREWKPLTPLVLTLLLGACLAVLWFERDMLKESLSNCGPAPQYRLGKCYAYGVVVAKNPTEAAKWFRLAAAQGHAQAQTSLAMLYVQGAGVTRDYSAAANLFQNAAKQGLAAAQNQLGMLYAQGKGLHRDLDQAADLFEQAARQGFRPAAWNLKVLATVRAACLPSLTLSNGRIYHLVTVQKVDSENLVVSYRPVGGGMGMAKLAFKDLPAAVQVKYGYDPGATAELPVNERLLAFSLRTF